MIWVAIIAFLLAGAPAAHAQRQMEALDRGMVAVRSTTTNAYVGWRLLGDDPAGIAFNLYRSANGGAAVKLNPSPLTTTTDFTDTTANLTQSNAYHVRPVIDGAEQAPGETFTLPANTPVRQYLTVPLQLPPGGTTLSGAFTYTANDSSVGDLDGDKDLELVVKWDPTNSKDNSQSGHTGNILLDAYQFNGTRLWQIDFGPNIRSGAHYMDFMVYDFDGDGQAEIMARTAPGTKDGTGAYVGGVAKWQGGSRPAFNDTDDYRNSSGYILTGPEFLTVFDGLTGAELATVRFFPQRDPDNLIDNPTGSRMTTLWGDSYGNRIDRFLAAVAYVDGQRPSGIFCRGYYTRTFVSAYDWRGGLLTKRWSFDSAANPSYAGQGAHSISVGDLDDDGKDEIAYGACAIDDNGMGLWNTGLGHGDATHLSEMDPDSPGLKFFMPHESPGSYGIYGTSLTEQRDGEILWGAPGAGDVGRGAASDIDPRFPGYEAWATNSGSVFTVKGVPIPNSSRPSVNFAVWWDADPLRELLDSNRVDKWNWSNGSASNVLTMSGATSNNGTKATPNLSADILGDWREEILLRTTDNTAMRIYTTTNPATSRLYTLLHDPQYRVAVAWQNTGYNQPPHPGFFLGHDMAPPPRAPIWHGDLVWQGAAGGNTWTVGGTARWLRGGVQSTYLDGDSVLLDQSGNTSSVLELSGTLAPGEVIVHNAVGKSYTFGGTGSLGGAMTLTKAGLGALTIGNTQGFTGATSLQQGDLVLTGTLAASQVTIEGLGRATGTGTFGNGLIVKARGRLAPGTTGAGTLNVGNRLDLTDAFLDIDLGNSPAASNDTIAVTGNLNLNGITRITINRLAGTLGPGAYPLITYSGTLTGSVANFAFSGLAGAPGTLSISGGAVVLTIAATRAPGPVTWSGTGAIWNLAATQNWLLGGAANIFVTGDTVTFNATGAASPTVTLVDELIPASVSVDSTSNYTFSGAGMIGGSGGLTKANTGKLTVQTANTYTGATEINGGILEVATVGGSGVASTLGAASASSSNLVFNGGTLRYTGGLSATNRGATFSSGGGTLEVSSGSGNLVMGGTLAGTGGLTKTGTGTLNLGGVNTYSGGTVIKAGTVLLGSFEANEDGVGTGLVTLDGGTLSMTDLQSNNNCSWPLHIPAGSTGRLNADGRCVITGALTGGGTFIFHIPYVRTGLNGNWSAFTGQINVVTNGDGGDFRINNSAGYANARISFANLVNAYSLTGSTTIGEVTGGSGSTMSGTAWTIGAKNTDAIFGGSITGNSVNKVGTGFWRLTGTNSYSGTTTVTAGALLVDGSLTNSNVTVQSGATLGGSGTITRNVTINSGGTLDFAVDGGTVSNLTIAGNLTLNGTVKVGADIISGGLPNGTHVVASYGGTYNGTPAFAWTPPPGSTQTATFDTTTPGVIKIIVAPGGPNTLTWTGGTSSAWDAVTPNWTAEGAAAIFQNSNSVIFDDTASGTTVAVSGSVAPTDILFDHSSKNFTLTGPGIEGATTLIKTGSGKLSVSGANTHSGVTTLTGGIIAIVGGTANAQRGLGSGGISFNGGRLEMNGWTGSNGTSYGTLSNPLEVLAGATGTLAVSQRGDLTGALTGAGTLNLVVNYVRGNIGGNWSAFTGRINVLNTGADVDLFRVNNLAGYPAAALDLGTNVSMRYFGNLTATVPVGELGGAAGSGLIGLDNNNNTVGANTLTWEVGARGTDATFAGTINNGTSPSLTALRKVGAGTWTLAGTTTYSGPTNVVDGILRITGSVTGTNSLTVAAAATLEMSGGNLTVAGPVVNNGTIRLYGTPALSSTGSFTNNGILDLINGPPALPANFVNNGIVLDSSGVRAQSIAVSGGNVTVTIQSYPGHSYQLQTRDSLSAGNWQNTGSAQHGATGTVLNFIAPIDPGAPTGFYRVVVTP